MEPKSTFNTNSRCSETTVYHLLFQVSFLCEECIMNLLYLSFIQNQQHRISKNNMNLFGWSRIHDVDVIMILFGLYVVFLGVECIQKLNFTRLKRYFYGLIIAGAWFTFFAPLDFVRIHGWDYGRIIEDPFLMQVLFLVICKNIITYYCFWKAYQFMQLAREKELEDSQYCVEMEQDDGIIGVVAVGCLVEEDNSRTRWLYIKSVPKLRGKTFWTCPSCGSAKIQKRSTGKNEAKKMKN